jgi:hypothetical protein
MQSAYGNRKGYRCGSVGRFAVRSRQKNGNSGFAYAACPAMFHPSTDFYAGIPRCMERHGEGECSRTRAIDYCAPGRTVSSMRTPKGTSSDGRPCDMSERRQYKGNQATVMSNPNWTDYCTKGMEMREKRTMCSRFSGLAGLLACSFRLLTTIGWGSEQR